MGAHITPGGEFQSDKYPTTPPGKVPLSVKDSTAQDLLWEYAQRRRPVDAEFAEDLEGALRAKGYAPGKIASVVLDGVPIAKIEELLELYGSRNVRMLPDGRLEVDVADPPVPKLAVNREDRGGDGTIRKAHYGQGVQPWDVTLASGWGPHAAAFCVVRYLGRTKAPEHSIESARWYYERLYAGAAGKIESPSTPGEWEAALARLELLLTNENVVRLRGST